MALVVPIKRDGFLAARVTQFRRDVEDALLLIRIGREQELSRSVTFAELLPIPVEVVASELGLQIKKVEELGGVPLDNPWAERDTEVPGLLDRRSRIITIAERQRPAERRYTIAHEIAHLLYHSSPQHLRQRARRAGRRNEYSAPEGAEHAREEREAEIFAAELLMPVALTREAMLQRFGSPIDCTVPREELAHLLGNGVGEKIDALQLSRLPQEKRAALFASATSFGFGSFERLSTAFAVSTQAMAIRLVELGLVV